mgnify:FL=1
MNNDNIIRMLDDERQRRQQADEAHLQSLGQKMSGNGGRWFRRRQTGAIILSTLAVILIPTVYATMPKTVGMADYRDTNVSGYRTVCCNRPADAEAVVQCANLLLSKQQ